MGKIWTSILFIGLFVYLIIVLTFVAVEREKAVCGQLHISIKDKEVNSFIEEADVERFIRKRYGEIVNTPVNRTDKDSLEKILINNSIIKSAEVYTALDGSFHIEIVQRKPILRILSGEGYYIDEDGKIIPLSDKHTARVLVATGNISGKFAREVLYPFVVWLKKDVFWDAYVEQIVVKSNGEVVLIPKVGNFDIILGEMERIEEKMEKLRYFLKDGIAKRGWNLYREVNLKFDKQVVCVKK